MKIGFCIACCLRLLPAANAAFAQVHLSREDDYRVFPIGPADGQFRLPDHLPFYNDLSIRNHGISKLILDRRAGKAVSKRQRVQYYTPSGFLLPTFDFENSQIDSLSVTAGGQPALLELSAVFNRYHPGGRGIIDSKRLYQYTYQNGRLVRFESRDADDLSEATRPDRLIGQQTQLDYDSSENLLSLTSRGLDAEGRTALVQRRQCFQYDSQGRLFRIFEWKGAPAQEEALLHLPKEIAFDLLRKDFYWQDTVSGWLYGSEQEMSQEARAAMLLDRRRRDSLSAAATTLLRSESAYLTSFRYDRQDRLCETLKFWRDELASRDSFVYDRRGQLTQWKRYSIYKAADVLESEIWDFTYNKRRISRYSVLLGEARPFPSRRLRPLTLVGCLHGKLQYNRKGEIQELRQVKENYLFNQPEPFRSEVRYRFRYEYFGTK